jgi:hypothetical protein
MKSCFLNEGKLVVIFFLLFIAISCNKYGSENQKIQDKKIEHTITFESDSFHSPEPIKIVEGEGIPNLPDALNWGYTFGGWFTEKDGKGIVINKYSVITEDIAVYAKWDYVLQDEFNAYSVSQRIREEFIIGGHYYYISEDPLWLEDLVSFSKGDLRLLRNAIYAQYDYKFDSPDLINYFSKFKWYNSTEDDVDSLLTDTDRRNIDFIKTIENNFPAESSINNDLIGLWRIAYAVPDQGYAVGDYIKIYNNGIFEYIYRNFRATRYRNKILGGSKYGLWTSENNKNQENEFGLEELIIPEIATMYDNNKVISIYGDKWWIISEDVNYGLEWGDYKPKNKNN